MSCQWFLRNIEAYLEGQLTPREQQQMAAHAEQCEACRRELEFSKAIAQTVRNLPPISVPEDFMSRLNEQIDQQPVIVLDNRYKRFQKKWAGGWRKYSAVAACAAFAVMVRVDAWNLAQQMTTAPQDLVGREQVCVTTIGISRAAEDGEVELSQQTPAPSAAVLPQFVQGQKNIGVSVKPSAAPSATVKPAASPAAQSSSAQAGKTTVTQKSTATVTPAPKANASKPGVKTTPRPVTGKPENTAVPATEPPLPSDAPEQQATPQPENNGFKLTPDTVLGGSDEAVSVTPQKIDGEGNDLVDGYTEVPGIANGLYANVDVPEKPIAAKPREVDPPGTTTMGNSISVSEQDRARVLELIENYKEDTYGSYYFLTEEKLNEFLEELDQEGIHYNRRIVNNEGGNIAFRFVIA